MQLEIYLKLYLLCFADNAENLATYILEDKDLSKYKISNIKCRLTYSNIAHEIDKKMEKPWVKSMYQYTSQFIHPTKIDVNMIIKDVHILGEDVLYSYFIDKDGLISVTSEELLNLTSSFINLCRHINHSLKELAKLFNNGRIQKESDT